MPTQKLPDNSADQATGAGRVTKRADELTAGDFVHGGDLIPDYEGVTEVLFVHPTPGLDRVTVILDGGEYDPQPIRAAGGHKVRIATETELAEARVSAARAKIAGELRALADLIQLHDLPLPKYALQISFVHGGDSADREANLRMVAERLGLPITHSFNRRHEVAWPMGRQSYEQGVLAEWHADLDPEPVADEPADEHMGRTTAVADAKPDTLIVAHGHGPGRTNGVF